MDTQGYSLITVTIPSDLRIPISYYYWYVDDMLVVGSSMKEIVNFKARLAEKFSMKDLGPTKKVLGIRISEKRKEIVEDITS